MVIVVPWRTPVGDTGPGSEERPMGGGGGEKTDDEPRLDITDNLQEVPTAGRHRPTSRPAGAWGGGWGPRVPPHYSENFDTRSWAWNTFGGELCVAPERVALQLPKGLDPGRGEAHGTRSGCAPDAEGVGVQVARGMESRMEDVPQAVPGQI